MLVCTDVVPLVLDGVTVLKDDIGGITSCIPAVLVVKVESLLVELPKVEVTSSDKVPSKKVPLLFQ